jgi:hypothetical protein
MAVPKVFVVQNQMRYEHGELVARFDLKPAMRFGKLCYLLNDNAMHETMDRLVRKLDLLLENFSDNDYLLAIGHPALIGAATAVAASHNQGNVTQLVWSGRDRDYQAISARLPVRRMLLSENVNTEQDSDERLG